MSGDTGLTDLFQTQFSTLLRLKLQQKESKLRGRVMEGTHPGAKQASPVQYLGPTSMKTPQGRFAPKQYDEQDYSRRWVMPVDKENDQLVDNFDQLKTPIDPKSQLVARVAAAANRSFDDAIITAATATSTIGTDAGSLSTEAWDTTDFQIAGNFGAPGGAVGLTVAKLNEAHRILEHYHALDEDKQITLVIGSQQHADLRNQALVSGAEFGYNGGVLVNGEVTKYMGMDVVVSERLQTITDKNSTANQRSCLVFVKFGLYLGIWQDIKTEVLRRSDLSSNPWDINTMISFGATRLELGRVVQVCAADTTGNDVTAP